MKIKIGVTRRAQWKPLAESFVSTSATSADRVIMGGWETLSNGSDRKIMVALDDEEARKLYQLLKGRFEREGNDD